MMEELRSLHSTLGRKEEELARLRSAKRWTNSSAPFRLSRARFSIYKMIAAYQDELKIANEIRVGYDRALEEKALELDRARKELEEELSKYIELMDE